jgi:TIR domain
MCFPFWYENPVSNYDVALSFAVEQRWYVELVNSELKALGISTFYDEDWQVDLWGKDLNEAFTEIYSKQAKSVLMFISKEYVEKVWTRVERRAALSRAINEKGEYILPVRFDHTSVPGLPSTVKYIVLQDLSAKQLAHLVCRKIGREIPPSFIATGPPPGSKATSNEVTFNYWNHSGRFLIGSGDFEFDMRWSKAGLGRIYCYSDGRARVALVPMSSRLSDVTKASTLDYSSRVRAPSEGRFLTLQNPKGYFAAVKIIKALAHEDELQDSLTMKYWILRDGSENFSGVEE